MKTLIFSFAFVSTLALTSCDKEDVGPRLRREAQEKIIGQWTLERRVSEVYSPIVATPVPGTAATTEYIGNASDYFRFREDGKVEIDTATAGRTESFFEVINPSQVGIGERAWRIDELTSTKLLLVWDRNDGAQDKRFITRLYLKR